LFRCQKSNESSITAVGVMQRVLNARDVSALVAMPRLLAALAVEVNERTRRAACPVHSGSNRSAFSWREDGRWHCFSCGNGGDRIALVRATRNCTFSEAVQFLAQLAGVKFSRGGTSRAEIAEVRQRRHRAEEAAWRVRDEIVRLRAYYRDGLHRTERLWARIGDELLCTCDESQREAIWHRMAHLAPVSTFFVAAYNHIYAADSRELSRFALASPKERRIAIFGGFDAARISQTA
jgi:hypothetical protein